MLQDAKQEVSVHRFSTRRIVDSQRQIHERPTLHERTNAPCNAVKYTRVMATSSTAVGGKSPTSRPHDEGASPKLDTRMGLQWRGLCCSHHLPSENLSPQQLVPSPDLQL